MLGCRRVYDEVNLIRDPVCRHLNVLTPAINLPHKSLWELWSNPIMFCEPICASNENLFVVAYLVSIF